MIYLNPILSSPILMISFCDQPSLRRVAGLSEHQRKAKGQPFALLKRTPSQVCPLKQAFKFLSLSCWNHTWDVHTVPHTTSEKIAHTHISLWGNCWEHINPCIKNTKRIFQCTSGLQCHNWYVFFFYPFACQSGLALLVNLNRLQKVDRSTAARTGINTFM